MSLCFGFLLINMTNENDTEARGIATESTTTTTTETRARDAPEVCGRLGCRETEDLVTVLISEYGLRVLCRRHAAAIGAQEAFR